MSRFFVILLVLVTATSAWAHPLDLAALRLQPAGDAVDVSWDLTLGAPGEPLLPVPSPPCTVETRRMRTDGPTIRYRATWDCGPEGLRAAGGTIPGAGDRELETLLQVGGEPVRALSPGTETWSATSARPSALRSGAEHLFGGLDHLAFVALLVVLCGLRLRALAATVTAFTVGHAVTLATTVLGGPAPAVAPVEALIAASVAIAAAEALRPEDERMLRRIVATAFGFGLLHGFGFAGGLAELGLSPDGRGGILLGFNLGLECAQLAWVAVVAAAVWMGLPGRAIAWLAGVWGSASFFVRLLELGS